MRGAPSVWAKASATSCSCMPSAVSWPSTLEAWGEMLKASPLVSQADAERMITDLRMISTWQWLWTDYMLTIIMGAVWGLIVGLALRRN